MVATQATDSWAQKNEAGVVEFLFCVGGLAVCVLRPSCAKPRFHKMHFLLYIDVLFSFLFDANVRRDMIKNTG